MRNIDRAELQIMEQLVGFERTSACVLVAGPQWRGAAVGVADAQVLEIMFEWNCFGWGLSVRL